MPRWKRRKPAIDRTTSEHLAEGFRILEDRLRRAGAGLPPDQDERRLLIQLAEDFRRLANADGVDPALKQALEGSAGRIDSLLDPPAPPAPYITLPGG